MQLTTICESTENFIDYKFAAGSVWNLIKFVTVQYLHSYMQKSIPNRLRRWDFCLLAYVFLRSAQQVRRPTEQLLKFYNNTPDRTQSIRRIALLRISYIQVPQEYIPGQAAISALLLWSPERFPEQSRPLWNPSSQCLLRSEEQRRSSCGSCRFPENGT